MIDEPDLPSLYPERCPYAVHRLKVDEIHVLHIEECGNPDGLAVLWCHGGPGGGLGGKHGRQFDPAFYRIILFDQRGAGKSTPYAEIRQNTTSDLITDIEKIRLFLKIDRWIVAGRSWGTTLSLLYAQAHPQRVLALFLAAIFLCDRAANQWLFQQGASLVYPEAWAPFRDFIRPEKRHNFFEAYKEILFGADEKLAIEAAKIWSTWGVNTCSVLPNPAMFDYFLAPEVTFALARIECHYLGNDGFIEEGHILRECGKIAHIPTKIIHGRYDMNCTFDNALRLHQALPNSELICVPLGGHADNDMATMGLQIKAAESLKTLFI
jgi:proline iminopeptidase